MILETETLRGGATEESFQTWKLSRTFSVDFRVLELHTRGKHERNDSFREHLELVIYASRMRGLPHPKQRKVGSNTSDKKTIMPTSEKQL